MPVSDALKGMEREEKLEYLLDELVRLSAEAGPDGERPLSDAIPIAGVVDGVATQFFLEPELADWDRVLSRLRDIVSTVLDSP